MACGRGMSKPCAACGIESTLKCGGCKIVHSHNIYYCGTQCQKKDWGRHVRVHRILTAVGVSKVGGDRARECSIAYLLKSATESDDSR